MQWILTSRWRLLPATIGAVALVAMVSLAYSQPPGPPPGGPRGPYERGPRGPREERGDRPVETTELSGNVQGFNRNPLGAIDSLMLTADGKTVQVNFPPDLGGPIAGLASAGDSVKITAEKTPHRADHEIYRLIKFVSASGKELKLSRPEDAEQVHVEGIVRQLNYAPHGEIDGVLLENGDFVHFAPHSAEQIAPKVGQKVTVDGRQHLALASGQVIEAERINDVAIERRPPPRRGPGGPDGPAGRGPGRRGPEGDGPEDGPGGRGPRGDRRGPRPGP